MVSTRYGIFHLLTLLAAGDIPCMFNRNTFESEGIVGVGLVSVVLVDEPGVGWLGSDWQAVRVEIGARSEGCSWPAEELDS